MSRLVVVEGERASWKSQGTGVAGTLEAGRTVVAVLVRAHRRRVDGLRKGRDVCRRVMARIVEEVERRACAYIDAVDWSVGLVDVGGGHAASVVDRVKLIVVVVAEGERGASEGGIRQPIPEIVQPGMRVRDASLRSRGLQEISAPTD